MSVEYFQNREKELAKGDAFLIDGEVLADRSKQLFVYNIKYEMPPYPDDVIEAPYKTFQIAQTAPNSKQYATVVFWEMVIIALFLILLVVVNYWEYGLTYDKNIYLDHLKHLITNRTEILNQTIEFHEVSNKHLVLLFLNATFTRLLKWDVYHNESFFVTGNGQYDVFSSFLIGFPRYRQKISHHDSCSEVVINNQLFLRYVKFPPCINKFSETNEDLHPRVLTVEKEFIPSDFLTYSMIGKLKTKGTENDYAGLFDTYSPGGFITQFLFERLPFTPAFYTGLYSLEKNNMFNRETRAIFVEANMYCIELNMYTYLRIAFEKSMFGEYYPKFEYMAVNLYNSHNIRDCIYLGLCGMVYIFAGFLALEELWEIFILKEQYFIQIWSYIDVAIIACVFMSLPYQILFTVTFQKRLKDRDDFSDVVFDDIIKAKWTHRVYLLLAMYLTLLRLVRYLHNFSMMRPFNEAMETAKQELYETLLYAGIFMTGFTIMGSLAFGQKSFYFLSLTNSFFSASTVFAKLLKYENHEAANSTIAPFYLVMLFLFFVGFKYIIVIIMSNIVRLTTKTTVYRSSAGDYVACAPCYRLLRYMTASHPQRLRLHYISDILCQECGFSRLELIIFLRGYDIIISGSLPQAKDYPTEDDSDYYRGRGAMEKKQKSYEEQLKNLTISDMKMLQNYLDLIEAQVEIMSERILGIEESMHRRIYNRQQNRMFFNLF